MTILISLIMSVQSPIARSPIACIQCRARKVKCIDDAEEGLACRSCRRLAFPCSRTTSRPSSGASPNGTSLASSGVERRRISRACLSCRAGKSKCSGDRPCERCLAQSTECEYPQSKRHTRTPVRAQLQARTSVESSPHEERPLGPLDDRRRSATIGSNAHVSEEFTNSAEQQSVIQWSDIETR